MEIDLQEYSKAWRCRGEQQERKRQELSAKALIQAKLLSQMLKETYNCETVYLIGSLARQEFQLDSDIDLVVKGLPDRVYYRALSELSLVSEFPVDLVPFEAANELLKEYVAAEGVEL